MRNLFQFISKNHVLLLFIVLELLAFLMIVQNNSFQRTAFLNSTNGLTSNIFRTITTWQDYWSLKSTNHQLTLENATLKMLISMSGTNDSISSILPNRYISAMVINNSVAKRNNYLTLDKGESTVYEKGWGRYLKRSSWDSKSFSSFLLSTVCLARQSKNKRRITKIKLFWFSRMARPSL